MATTHSWRTVLVALTAAAVTACAADTPTSNDEADSMPPARDRSASADPTAIRPFEINVPEDVLIDLRERLARTRLPDQMPGTEWDYGTNRAYLEELLVYWQNEFDCGPRSGC